MKNFINNKKIINFLSYILGIIFIFSIWFILSKTESNIIVPRIKDVFIDIFHLLFSESVILIFITILKLLIIIVISFIISLFIAILSYKFEGFYNFISPIIGFMRSVPVASFIIIICLLIGDSLAPLIITMFVIVPIASENIYSSFKNINNDIIEETKLISNINMKIFFILFIPLTLKQIISSVLSCFGLGLKVLVMGEVITQAKNTIGNEIQLAKLSYLDYTRIFSWTIILLTFVLIIEYILKRIEKKI